MPGLRTVNTPHSEARRGEKRGNPPPRALHPTPPKSKQAAWLTGGKKNTAPPADRRPPRRFYRTTGAAIAAAHTQLTALSEQYRPPAITWPRLAPHGSTL